MHSESAPQDTNKKLSVPNAEWKFTESNLRSSESDTYIRSTEPNNNLKSTEPSTNLCSTELNIDLKSTETNTDLKSTESKADIKSTEERAYSRSLGPNADLTINAANADFESNEPNNSRSSKSNSDLRSTKQNSNLALSPPLRNSEIIITSSLNELTMQNDDDQSRRPALIAERLKSIRSKCCFCCKQFLYILSLISGAIILIALLFGLPIAMIVIGSKYLYDCPCERYIPIYLIVGGVFGIIVSISTILEYIFSHYLNDSKTVVSCCSFVYCFVFAWFIAGSNWVFKIRQLYNDDPTSPFYCHSTLYLFAFWMLISSYILTLLFIVFIVGYFICLCKS